MSVELEIKLRVEAHEPVRTALASAGAVFVRAGVETNRIYDQADGSLRRAGAGLRVRSVAVERGTPAEATLTYKGPRQAGPMKRREEIEVGVEDAERVAAVLDRLGLVEVLRFEKRRETWQLAGCTVELDEVAGLGRFVEIEGPDEGQITAVRSRLGLASTVGEPATYVGLLMAQTQHD